MKVAHESDPSGFPPTQPGGIRQGLRSIRPQGSHPRLLQERERASGKSHEPSGCQQTLSNHHPHLEAKALELLQRIRKRVRITLYRVPTGHLHPPRPAKGRAAEQLWGHSGKLDQAGLCPRGENISKARWTSVLPGGTWPWNCLPGKRTPSACPTLTEAPDPHPLLQLQPSQKAPPRGSCPNTSMAQLRAGVMGVAREQ